MKEKNLFLDFEFTMPEDKETPRSFYPEVIEVGMIAVLDGEIICEYSSYVKPIKFPVLTERCKSFLQISQENVDEGISFEQLVECLSEYANYTVITWGNMDLKVLNQNATKAKVVYPFKGRSRDFAVEYKKFFGNRNQTGLWKAVQEYGDKGTGKHHRALDDAFTTYNIFKLVEQDKQYLDDRASTTIGDRIDFSKLKDKFV